MLLYFMKASATSLPVLVAFLSPTLEDHKERENVKIAFCAVSLLSVLASTVPLVCSSGLQDDPIVDNDAKKDSLQLLCAAAYLSNISLIITVVLLAVLLNPAYVAPTSPVLLLSFPLIVYCGFTVYQVKKKPEEPFRWRNVLNHKHATDFTFVVNVSSEVTQTSLFGLSAALFGDRKTSQQRQGQARNPSAAEALVYAAVFGLAMMLACSVPPAIANRRYRENVVNKFIRVAACILVALVATAAFAAVVTLLQGYVAVALAVVIVVSVLWFLKLYYAKIPGPEAPEASKPPEAPKAQGADEQAAAGELQLPMWKEQHERLCLKPLNPSTHRSSCGTIGMLCCGQDSTRRCLER